MTQIISPVGPMRPNFTIFVGNLRGKEHLLFYSGASELIGHMLRGANGHASAGIRAA